MKPWQKNFSNSFKISLDKEFEAWYSANTVQPSLVGGTVSAIGFMSVVKI
jgi:hypothetical protein